MSCTRALFSSQFSELEKHTVVFVAEFPFVRLCLPMVGESFQKNCLEEWMHTGDDSSGEQCMANIHHDGTGYCSQRSHFQTKKQPEEAPSAPRPAGQPDALT